MANPFGGLFKARDKPKYTLQDAVSAAMTFLFGRSASNKYVTPRTSFSVPIVYACVRVIAETVASLPFEVYERTDLGHEKAVNHPMYHLLHDQPNDEMTSFVWRETVMTHLLLWGNSYSQIIRNGRGRVIGLYPLLPERMVVDRDENGKLTYTYTKTDGSIVVLSKDDVFHIPGLGFDGIMGYSPIAVERNAIGLGIAAEEYGSKFFANGATPSGILTHPNHVKDPKALRESWQEAYGGSSNSNRVAVLEEGMTFTRVSMPNNEAQFLETRKFQLEEICRIYRVPQHLVGILEHSTFSNIEHQSIDFAVHTIRPWLVRIEQAVNNDLFIPSEKSKYYSHINIDGLMRGDYNSRMQGYAVARQNGWMSTNDIRELENMNLLPKEEGGFAYLVNGNMIPITQAVYDQNDVQKKLDEINLKIAEMQLDEMQIDHSNYQELADMQLEEAKMQHEMNMNTADEQQTDHDNYDELAEMAMEEAELNHEAFKNAAEEAEIAHEQNMEIAEQASEELQQLIENGELLTVVEETGNNTNEYTETEQQENEETETRTNNQVSAKKATAKKRKKAVKDAAKKNGGE